MLILKGANICNRYRITTNQAAIITLFRVFNRYVGNLPPMTGVFPDYPAPVIRNANSGLISCALAASLLQDSTHGLVPPIA